MVTLNRLYLCGPMTGLPEFNHPAFHTAAQSLRAVGYQVFNPAENGLSCEVPWHLHMRADIRALMDCAGLAYLPGSEHSKGAMLELHIAMTLGMPVAQVDIWHWKAFITPDPSPLSIVQLIQATQPRPPHPTAGDPL